MRSLKIRGILLLVISATTGRPSPCVAQEPARMPAMEGLPPHLEARLKPIRIPASVDDAAGRQVLSRSTLWPAGARLKVSFLEGLNQDVCRSDAAVAREWSDHANISFDFGQAAANDDCRVYEPGDGSVIRISFIYPGHWSLIGTDARTKAMPGEPTMNFQDFAYNPPPKDEFRAVVLHEFGHVLGFRHEHQNPQARCEQEFDWDAVYKALVKPPNHWDHRMVDKNLRRLNYLDSPSLLLDFDPKSVMNYQLDRRLFKRGENSPCYIPRNASLSDGDKRAASEAFPRDAAAYNEARLTALRDLIRRPGLPADTRGELRSSRELLASVSAAGDLPGPAPIALASAYAGGGAGPFAQFVETLRRNNAWLSERRTVEGEKAWAMLRDTSDQLRGIFSLWLRDIAAGGLADQETAKNRLLMQHYIDFFVDVYNTDYDDVLEGGLTKLVEAGQAIANGTAEEKVPAKKKER